ncbi:MAG: radical SAM protein [candidate division WOR-3 bacterium]|nr:radical SAM protein [candidate division WOR-3 bacterium]
MGKKALLINPWIYDFKAFDFWSKPLGLLYLGALLQKHNWEIYLIDCLDRYHPKLLNSGKKLPKVDEFGRGKYIAEVVPKPEIYKHYPRRYKRYGLPEEIFRKILLELPKPDWIFVTSQMTYWYLGVFSTINIIKETFPKIPIVLGGIYTTLCYEHALRHSGANYVLPGPVEESLFRLFPEIPKYTFPELPFPAFNLYHKLDYVTILTSRGCIFRCNYCAVHYLVPNFVCRTVQTVINELEIYAQSQIKNIVFYDDALLANPNFSSILDEIKNRRFSFQFHTPNGLHPRFITEEIAQKMKEVNFKTIYLSLETIDPRLHDLYDQKVTKNEFTRAVNNLKKAGFDNKQIHAYLLIGLPLFDFDTIKESIDFVLSLGVTPHLAEYSPIPHTQIYRNNFSKNLSEPLLHNNIIFPLLNSEEKNKMAELKKYLIKIRQTSLLSKTK